jgi:hypothetical protein
VASRAVDTKETCTTIYGWLKKYATMTTSVLTWKLWQWWPSCKGIIRNFVVSWVQGTTISRYSNGYSKEKKILGQKKVAHRSLVDKTKIYFTSISRKLWVNQSICEGDE